LGEVDVARRWGVWVMRAFFGNLFGKEEGSKSQAKERLRLVLVHDRSSISPRLMEALKTELIDTISKYVEIDEEGIDVTLDRDDDTIALVTSIPIRSVKRVLQQANS